jgi:hypothetical protein
MVTPTPTLCRVTQRNTEKEAGKMRMKGGEVKFEDFTCHCWLSLPSERNMRQQ